MRRGKYFLISLADIIAVAYEVQLLLMPNILPNSLNIIYWSLLLILHRNLMLLYLQFLLILIKHNSKRNLLGSTQSAFLGRKWLLGEYLNATD